MVLLVLVLQSVLMLLEQFQKDHSILVHYILVFAALMDVLFHLELHKLAVHLVPYADWSTFD